jgi:D-psicose/D-tagatose/L-ribulose 3-epimerase
MTGGVEVEKKQRYEIKNDRIKNAFVEMKRKQPERFVRRLNLSWSNWGFGLESLADSAARLEREGVRFIELHGNHYGPDLGYKAKETLQILEDHNLQVSGICGMFSSDNDLSSARPHQRQRAIDYLKREIDFAGSVNADYLLVVPGAVGRPVPYDDFEFERSVATLRLVADLFIQHSIKAAVEPIRSAEVSFVHTIRDAKRYIDAVNHPGVRSINGDVYHMQVEEAHIGEALLEAGDMLVNLHMADSHRGALGEGSLDLDTIIMSLYLIGFNTEGKCVTPEPLGPGGDPYPAMNSMPDGRALDALVHTTVTYFTEREDYVRSLS